MPLPQLVGTRLASEFSWSPSVVLVLAISSKYLVILAKPTSRCDEISGSSGGALLSLSPALLPFLLASCLFLLLLRLLFEGVACAAR